MDAPKIDEPKNEIVYKYDRARRWAFTFHNYTDENVEYLKNIPADKADFIIFGFELTKEGIPHLQGYVEFGTALVRNTVKARLDPFLKKRARSMCQMHRRHEKQT